MAIARTFGGSQELSKPTTLSLLPSEYCVLYELTKLPEDKLEIALAEGWVRPETRNLPGEERRQNGSMLPI
ncbi:MAG: hypothetical protein ACR652_00820 [Methylocystis sp.]|uniref:hypothetical protein n=1 Tax=Methylocystis sp. TaxID=1911079 RepID=UPI003DA23420